MPPGHPPARWIATASFALVAMLTLAVDGNVSAVGRLPTLTAVEVDELPALPAVEPTNSLPQSVESAAETLIELIPPVAAAGAVYRVDQVARWALEASPGAAALRGEAASLRTAADRQDNDARCAADLAADVLELLAQNVADADATSAATVYWQLVGAGQARVLLAEATATQRDLLELAEAAERLSLPDGDSSEIRDGLLELEDRDVEKRFESLKLRQRLAQLTLRPESEVATAVTIDPLPVAGQPIDTAATLAAALAGRRDLRAVSELCRRISVQTLPATRTLLGQVSPGLGLMLASGGGGGLLAKLHDDDERQSREASARRRQACGARDDLAAAIRHETLQAVLDVRAAAGRLAIADRRVELAGESVAVAMREVKVDRQPPGSDLIAQLSEIERRGDQLRRRVELATAMVTLVGVADGFADGVSVAPTAVPVTAESDVWNAPNR